MGINLQQLLDTALAEHDAEIDAQTAAKIKAALDADAIEDAKALKVKDDEIARLNARIAELEAGNPDPEPEPEPEEPEEPTPPAGTFPNASNTGVPAGVVLKPYTGPTRITQNGYVIDGADIKVPLIVAADNVTIKNSRIKYAGFWGIDADNRKNLTVIDTEIIGPGSSGDANAAILGQGTFLRLKISKSENGIVLLGGKSVVKGCYIFDLENSKGNNGHYDGIGIQGGQTDCEIEGNTIESWDTSCVFIKGDYSAITNTLVKGNLLLNSKGRKPSYTVYSVKSTGKALPTGTKFIDNIMERGLYGYADLEGDAVWQGNHAYDKNAPGFKGAAI